MLRVFSVRGNRAGSLAWLQLQIHREEHDARGRIGTKPDLSGGGEWFAITRDRVEGDGSR